MKKSLLSLSIALILGIDTATAIPAQPGKIRVQQPNGTYVTIELRGDEYSHTAYTEDGYPLLFNSQSQQYEYASICGGQLISSGYRMPTGSSHTFPETFQQKQPI